jgi:hypothetical protein
VNFLPYSLHFPTFGSSFKVNMPCRISDLPSFVIINCILVIQAEIDAFSIEYCKI